MAAVGEHESYHESRLRERRLQAYPHWEEILLRLQHRWPVRRVIRWHEEKFPGAPCPPRMTLCRYVKSNPSSWFISKLVLAESGTRMAHRLLVCEEQASLIESMKMRIARALQFEESMNGLLIPEIRHNFAALGRLLVDHFRVQQELGVEPKRGSMSPMGAPAAESGTEKLLVQRMVELPHDEFMALIHRHYADRRPKAPLQPGEAIDVEAQVHQRSPAD